MGISEKIARYVEGDVHLQLSNASSVALKPQECWRLVEEAHNLLIENSSLFEPRVLREVSRGGRRFQVILSKNNGFWNSYLSGSWERHTFEVFDRFLTADATYLDIGAWIGPTLLYAAQVAKAAFGFEPDPVAFGELSLNVRANQGETWASKVTILNKAIANSSGRMALGSRGSGGDSESSFLFAGEATSWQVETVSLADFIRERGISGRMFIKMDIEGGEYDLMPALSPVLRAQDLDLYLSLHPSFLQAHLRKGSYPVIGRISRRIAFFTKHCRLLGGLPFKNIYSRSGAALNPVALKYGALRHGRFPTELVATNRNWDSQ
jgi:FkbM family methyltransferase